MLRWVGAGGTPRAEFGDFPAPALPLVRTTVVFSPFPSLSLSASNKSSARDLVLFEPRPTKHVTLLALNASRTLSPSSVHIPRTDEGASVHIPHPAHSARNVHGMFTCIPRMASTSVHIPRTREQRNRQPKNGWGAPTPPPPAPAHAPLAVATRRHSPRTVTPLPPCACNRLDDDEECYLRGHAISRKKCRASTGGGEGKSA